MKLQGIFPPLTVPFDAEGAIHLEHLQENIARYNKTGLAGYVVNGSTGESVLLTWPEIESVWQAAREAAGRDMTLIAGTGAESTAETIAHTKGAAELGFDAALVRTPSYYKGQMTFEAEAAHFTNVADASPIPVLIYSVPALTGYTAEAPLIVHLASHPNILGIKDSSGNVQRISDVVAKAPKRFSTLTGSGATLVESVHAGASGAILAISCLIPQACVDCYEAVRSGEIEAAQQLKKQMIAPAAAIVGKFGIPGIKFAMDRLGYFGGAPRGPLLPADESAKREIEGQLQNFEAAAVEK